MEETVGVFEEIVVSSSSERLPRTRAKLDVGCGIDPRGSVNCDVNRPPFQIPNFILASGCHLPFKSGAFKAVYSSHVIEHSPNPYLFLRELVRVSTFKVVVRCPWRLSIIAKSPEHRHYFRLGWFNEQAKKLDCICRANLRIDPDRDLFPPSLEIRAILHKSRHGLAQKQ